MSSAPDGGEMLDEGGGAGPAVASVGLWIAFAAGAGLVLIGIAAALAGMAPAVWIITAGAVCSVGTALALRGRKQ
ncbi:hypothetical protein ACLGI4_01090 [Streptomyces sp. HMX112]|uniref:hypothetical protein n=1 Tax=Streptomyces sp. HMX112 TaxID=3390850 RepID=UPI003A80C8FB